MQIPLAMSQTTDIGWTMPDGTDTSTTDASTGKDDSLLGGGTETTPAPAPTSAPEKKEEPAAEVKYEFKNAPDGYDVKALEAFAKELGVSPEKAQKLLDRELDLAKRSNDSLEKEFEQTVKIKWVQEIKTDPKLGGDKFEESKAIANRAWDGVPNELKAEIAKHNLQNNPALFRIMHHIGNSMREGKFVRAGEQSNTELPSTQKFYGK